MPIGRLRVEVRGIEPRASTVRLISGSRRTSRTARPRAVGLPVGPAGALSLGEAFHRSSLGRCPHARLAIRLGDHVDEGPVERHFAGSVVHHGTWPTASSANASIVASERAQPWRRQTMSSRDSWVVAHMSSFGSAPRRTTATAHRSVGRTPRRVAQLGAGHVLDHPSRFVPVGVIGRRTSYS